LSNSKDVQHIRAVDSIVVGGRHRQDLGDLESLVASIRAHGLLQPLTVTPDGVLICGARRLAALKRLGIREVTVWVRAGISDRLGALMAERDENVEHKSFAPSELSGLYEELKREIAADAARRVASTQFQPGQRGHGQGSAKSALPPDQVIRDSRIEAARLLGNALSHASLEKVTEIQHLATDPATSPALRELAAQAIDQMDTTGKIESPYRAVKAATRIETIERAANADTEPALVRQTAQTGARAIRRLRRAGANPADIDKAAREVLARISEARQTTTTRPGPAGASDEGRSFRSVRAFVWTWTDMAEWPTEWDPTQIGPALTQDQWAAFTATIAAGNQFHTQAQAARNTQTQTQAA
jgi:ParB family chromosome partitioning protein